MRVKPDHGRVPPPEGLMAIARPTLLLASIAILTWTSLKESRAEKVRYFPLSNVKLLDGPFLNAAKVNRDHLLKFEPDRLLAPFLTEARLEPKALKYPNWESTGLNGHTAGHYMSALAGTYATLGDEECRKRLDYMVGELARCQEASGDGYIGGIPDGRQLWQELANGDIRASGFALNDRWVPFYNLHKTFAGLRDAYLVTENDQSKQVLVNLSNWCAQLAGQLSDEQLQLILACEHGGMNEVLADVAEITGEPEYLKLAERFSHREILTPLAAGQDQLSGMHANTQVPKVIGFERIASLGGDPKFHRAAQFFWQTVVGSRTVAFGGNSVNEHFPAPSQSMEWINQRSGPETCNTYNMLRLTEALFRVDPDPRLADYYERALYNHILSSQHPVHGGYVYFTSLRPRHYRVYSKPEYSFWCCVGSGMENHGRYGKFIYARDENTLLVNLFIASQLDWPEKDMKIRQETDFPDQSKTIIVVSCEQPTDMTLRIRHPSWVMDGKFRLAVNGDALPSQSEPGAYVSVERTWQDGDSVEVELPMHTTVETLPHLDEYVALLHGPIVLAARTAKDDLRGLVAENEPMDQIAHGPIRSLDTAPMLVGGPESLHNLVRPVSGESLTFTLADAIRPDSFDGLELIPFFRIHDARYMIYWRCVSPEKYREVREELAATERESLALDRATVDHVAPGEQQSETEHNFRGKRTETGMWQDRRFRHATGWFAYDLKTQGESDLSLQVTYWGGDRRKFDIFVDDKLLAPVDLDAPKPNEFIDSQYAIPRQTLAQLENGKLRVKFVADKGSTAGGIFDVRLIRSGEMGKSVRP